MESMEPVWGRVPPGNSEAALWQVITNGGAPGVDGVRVEDLKADGEQRKRWLAGLKDDLRVKTYRTSPVHPEGG